MSSIISRYQFCHGVTQKMYALVMKSDWVLKALISIWIGLSGLPFVVRAENSRTQSFALHKGWNAVFLELTPANPDVNLLFAQAPVSIVATYLAVERPVQFIRDPGTLQWNKDGWAVWYAASRPDAFLSSLHAIYGHQAYLILAQRDFT